LRVRYAAENSDAVFSALAELTEPETAHFAACTNVTAAKGQGHPIKPSSEAELLSFAVPASLVANGMAKIHDNGTPQWCLADTLKAKLPIAIYRWAGDRKGGSYEMVATTGSATTILMGIHDPFIALKNPKASDIYDVFVEAPDAVVIVGFSDGLPSYQDLARVTQSNDVTIFGRAEKFRNAVSLYGSACPRPVIHNGVIPPAMPAACSPPTESTPSIPAPASP
jgi:hypothetical protein